MFFHDTGENLLVGGTFLPEGVVGPHHLGVAVTTDVVGAHHPAVSDPGNNLSACFILLRKRLSDYFKYEINVKI